MLKPSTFQHGFVPVAGATRRAAPPGYISHSITAKRYDQMTYLYAVLTPSV